MGYRCDVIVAMKEEKFVEFVKSLSDKIAIDVFGTAEIRRRDGWTALYFSGVKWSYYEDAIDTFICDLCEDDYAYHILGEEQDDYEYKGTHDTPFDIRLKRSLEWDW